MEGQGVDHVVMCGLNLDQGLRLAQQPEDDRPIRARCRCKQAAQQRQGACSRDARQHNTQRKATTDTSGQASSCCLASLRHQVAALKLHEAGRWWQGEEAKRTPDDMSTATHTWAVPKRLRRKHAAADWLLQAP